MTYEKLKEEASEHNKNFLEKFKDESVLGRVFFDSGKLDIEDDTKVSNKLISVMKELNLSNPFESIHRQLSIEDVSIISDELKKLSGEELKTELLFILDSFGSQDILKPTLLEYSKELQLIRKGIRDKCVVPKGIDIELTKSGL